MSGRVGFGWVIVLRLIMIGVDVFRLTKRDLTRVSWISRGWQRVCGRVSILDESIYLAMQDFS